MLTEVLWEYFQFLLVTQTIARSADSFCNPVRASVGLCGTTYQSLFLNLLLFQHFLIFLKELLVIRADAHYTVIYSISSCFDSCFMTSSGPSWHVVRCSCYFF